MAMGEVMWIRVVVEAVAEHFGVNVRATSLRVLVFLDDERGRAFAHDKSIAQQIERPARRLPDHPS